MTVDASTWPDLLRLRAVADHTFEAPTSDVATRSPVFGGQILSQMIAAAHLDRCARTDSDKWVKSIQAVFARPGDYAKPLRYDVDRMHEGRTFGSDAVTLWQGGRVLARALILWSGDEPDLIRHTENVGMPVVAGPDDPRHRRDGRVFPGSVGLVCVGVDAWREDERSRPAVQHVWTRHGEDRGPVLNQAVVAWATDGYLVGAALPPHAGFAEAMALRTLSTGVVSHTLSFHEPFRGDEWLLLANEGVWAGRGRTHGRGTLWSQDGRLIATYVQDGMLREPT